MGIYLTGLLVIIGAMKVIDTLFCQEPETAEDTAAEAAPVYKH